MSSVNTHFEQIHSILIQRYPEEQRLKVVPLQSVVDTSLDPIHQSTGLVAARHQHFYVHTWISLHAL